MKRWIACAAVMMLLSNRGETLDYGVVKYWSADDLKNANSTGLPYVTTTHAYNLVHLAALEQRPAESHEGATDILFIVAGAGRVTAGGTIENPKALANMPGELRGSAVQGGVGYALAASAMINIPPSTPYRLEASASGLTFVRLKVNAGMHPWSIVQTQHAILASTNAHPRVDVPVNGQQGGVVYWSADVLRKASAAMSAAAAAGHPINDPRDLVALAATRTHAYNFLYRVSGPDGKPPGVEFHEGNTDIYFILAGTGTVMTGGTIENREAIPNKPGEARGTLITNGHGFKVTAGDLINIPPSTPHQSLPDAAGFSYVLIKVNTGVYPWSLIDN